jgi:phosphatidylglycerol lysyltransferase
VTGSIAGLLLLVLARGVRLKLRAAYVLTLQILAIGALASLLKGADYEEAAVLALMFALLAPARDVFYRLSRVDQAGLTLPWAAAIAAALGIATWVGFLAYRDIDYAHELWLMFDLHGDVSRFLRATLAVALLAGGVLAWFVLRRSRQSPHLPGESELQLAARLAAASPDSSCCLALTGDKDLFWNEQKSGFIAYVATRQYWIAIGDPCGPPETQDELVWQFREAADRYAAKTVFYRVRPETLPLYLDLGLSLLKLGEEAIVDLQKFDLKGSAKASLRNRLNRMQRDGWSCNVVPPAELEPLLPRLGEISDQWLRAKNTREKGISLGFFDHAYLKRTEIAVLVQGGQVMAFANLWRPEHREELSIDLMRYADDAPPGAMEFLLLSLMLWAREQGYRHFNLGMAPLSGFETHALAPLWNKLGSSVFRYGNDFYNFQGLRAYKDKFDPEWSPRYIALPSMLDTPAALLQITTLIAGGVRGIFAK